KTAVSTLIKNHKITHQVSADIALSFQEAVIDILTEKSLSALVQTALSQLVVAGGGGANIQLRKRLFSETTNMGATVFLPELEFCTDNGAMIAFAGAMRVQKQGINCQQLMNSCTVRARWDLETL